MATRDYRTYSFWLDSLPDDLEPRAALESDHHVDVAIVGGGYTGLWTAYYLKRADPSVSVAIVEKEICGFGASGRNGGWCSALFAGSRERTAARHGRDAAIALQRAMFDTVDEVGRVVELEGIDAHYAKGGTLSFATSRAQLGRVRESVEYQRSWGFGESDYTWLDAAEARARVDIAGCLGAAFTPHCAAIHPGRLARGLAEVVESAGVAIYEQTPAVKIASRTVGTPRGRLHAGVVVIATEAYTVELPRRRRSFAPIFSLMIVTEPLDRDVWETIGWRGRETMTDGRHLIIYSQRTADDRIAIGGRGAPYHFGSRIKDSYDREPDVFRELEQTLNSLLPQTQGACITHSWGGPIAIPRDWYSSVLMNRSAGIARAGGYVGDGVSTANLAGRTLRDLILEHRTELTRLPWVNHRSRRWEPEPLRWIGANLMLGIAASADKAENRRGEPVRRLDLVSKFVGWH
ncbi:MAG: NAD(P)/FAD-dependent oxidoreductase [Actinomycetota bacterium]